MQNKENVFKIGINDIHYSISLPLASFTSALLHNINIGLPLTF